jgi:hypothetical protein
MSASIASTTINTESTMEAIVLGDSKWPPVLLVRCWGTEVGAAELEPAKEDEVGPPRTVPDVE